jgi:class 3 adenylate cyclase
MAEARIVAVLLTDVVSSTQHLTHLGDEAGNAQRARHFELLRQCLARHGGQEVKNTGDGLLAVFASAVDAVRCATTMQQSVHADRLSHPDDGVEMKVGLHLGEPVQAEDDFFGAPMVLVTRLCSAAAPGQIVVSELLRTLVAAKHELRFEPIGELELKGLDAPVRAWSVPWQPIAGTAPATPGTFHAPLAAPVGRAAFVDRVQERGALDRWFARARQGQRVLGLVGGEPGVGKSRLVAEFARGAHESGATVLWGRCFEEAYVAHAPFVEALRAAFEWCCALDTPVPGVEAAGRHLCELAPSFAPACAADSAEGGIGRPTVRSEHEQGADRLRFFDAVDQVMIQLCAVAPVVLVLDDLQWADEDTLQLLSHLVRSPEADRLLILGTYRDTEVDRGRALSKTLADLRRERREDRLRLVGLDGAGVDDLVAALADGHLDEATVRAVGERTDGNPFLIEEVVSHLLESGDNVAPADAALPDGVREIIGRRLSRLSPVVESVLTVAAVLGREFSLDLLEPLLDVGRDALLDALDEALRAGLVREVDDRPGRYGFAHGLAREALVGELSATRRARLHQRIAEQLEATEPPLGDEARAAWTAEVAHHALAAVPLLDPLCAVGHVADAGEQALNELAYERAAELYDAAADTLESTGTAASQRPLRARIRLGSGTAHVLAGHGLAARAAFRACIDDAAELGDAALRARATLGLGTAVGSGVGIEFGVFNHELVALLQAALQDLPGGDTELRARLTARLGSAHGFSTDPARGVALCEEASAMAERLGDPVTIAACCNDLRAAAWSRVDLDEQQRLSDLRARGRSGERAGDRSGHPLARRERHDVLAPHAPHDRPDLAHRGW